MLSEQADRALLRRATISIAQPFEGPKGVTASVRKRQRRGLAKAVVGVLLVRDCSTDGQTGRTAESLHGSEEAQRRIRPITARRLNLAPSGAGRSPFQNVLSISWSFRRCRTRGRGVTADNCDCKR